MISTGHRAYGEVRPQMKQWADKAAGDPWLPPNGSCEYRGALSPSE